MPEFSVTPPLHFITSEEPKIHNPYDIKTWGSECGRGIAYADTGTRIAGRQSVLKISTARKSRGKKK